MKDHSHLGAPQVLQLLVVHDRDIFTIQMHCAACGWVQHIQAAYECGFAAARKADEYENLASLHAEVDVDETGRNACDLLHFAAGAALRQKRHSLLFVLRMFQGNKQLV